MSTWQRGDPKKRGKPPEPIKKPKEPKKVAGRVLTAEEQTKRKQEFLMKRKAVS